MTAPLQPLPKTDRIPPSVAWLLEEALSLAELWAGDEPTPLLLERLDQALDAAEPWASAEPALGAIGLRMIAKENHPQLRRRGCIWLTMFPSIATVDALAAIALDPTAPTVVRDQAAWTLGFRQAQARHPAIFWAPEVIARADAALVALAELEVTRATRDRLGLEELGVALRHVAAPALSELIARHPRLLGGAIEAFATEELARTLLARLDELRDEDRLRAIRLAAHTLGAEAAPLLAAKADDASMGDAIELRFCAFAVGGEAYAAPIERDVAQLSVRGPFEARLAWHRSHPAVIPTVRALRTSRTTACLPAEARPRACAAAADDFAALASAALPYPEAYLYAAWAWMVHGAGDAARAKELCELRPSVTGTLIDLYLRALAEAGRARRLATVAQEHRRVGDGVFLLAQHGRPFAALKLAAAAREPSAELLAGRALAAFRVGRPDLARAILEREAPVAALTDAARVEPFPGRDEQWRLLHAPFARPALAALTMASAPGRGIDGDAALDALLGLATGAPPRAEDDVASFEDVEALARRATRELRGATVHVAGELHADARAQVMRALAERGAQVVAGPFAETDFYLLGEGVPIATVAKLERLGARRLLREELLPPPPDRVADVERGPIQEAAR